jgi:LCP family protein required for cell wall assembly
MPHRKEKTKKRALFAVLIFLLVIAGLVGIKTWKYLSIGIQLLTNNKIELKQSEQKQINLLLLGVGGGTHEGPDLTDTIIFASLDQDTKKAVLVSIPRDLWLNELKAKINSAYTTGEIKQKGKGLLLASAAVEKVTGQPIDYALKIDFNGFVKAVDMIGGLDIKVDNTFDDYAYPLTGHEDDLCGHEDSEIASLSAQIATGAADELESFPCRYEHLRFDAGLTHMDGITALKYVRSRHAMGAEGSDFARSKRQEKVISAFKEKIFSLDVLLNPVKALSLIDVVKDSIDTNIKEDEYDDFIRLAQKFKSATITSAVLDTGGSTGRPGLLMNPPIGSDYLNQWVLIPRAGNGNYTEIRKYVECEINKGKCE